MARTIDRPVLRRALPGETGSHFDTTTPCPGDSCAAAAYRRGARAAGPFAVVVACIHGNIRADLAYSPVDQLAHFAPLVPVRMARTRGSA